VRKRESEGRIVEGVRTQPRLSLSLSLSSLSPARTLRDRTPIRVMSVAERTTGTPVTSSNRARAAARVMSGVATTRLVDMMRDSLVSGAAVSC